MPISAISPTTAGPRRRCCRTPAARRSASARCVRPPINAVTRVPRTAPRARSKPTEDDARLASDESAFAPPARGLLVLERHPGPRDELGDGFTAQGGAPCDFGAQRLGGAFGERFLALQMIDAVIDDQSPDRRHERAHLVAELERLAELLVEHRAPASQDSQ